MCVCVCVCVCVHLRRGSHPLSCLDDDDDDDDEEEESVFCLSMTISSEG